MKQPRPAISGSLAEQTGTSCVWLLGPLRPCTGSHPKRYVFPIVSGSAAPSGLSLSRSHLEGLRFLSTKWRTLSMVGSCLWWLCRSVDESDENTSWPGGRQLAKVTSQRSSPLCWPGVPVATGGKERQHLLFGQTHASRKVLS